MKFFTKEAAKIQEADRDRPQKDKSPPSSTGRESPEMHIWYYFLIKILILIRKASPDGAACFVIYKERNHKTSLIWTPCPSGN